MADAERARGGSVSCLSVRVFSRYLASRHRDDAVLYRDLPYSPAHLTNPNARVDFATFRTIAERFSAVMSDEPDAAYRAGMQVPELKSLGFMVVVQMVRLEPAIIFRLTPTLVAKQFPMAEVHYERTGRQRCRLTYEFAEGYECFREFVDVARGLIAATPTMAGMPAAKVDARPITNGVVLDVEWDARGHLLPQLRARTVERWRFFRQALSELEESKLDLERQLAETQSVSAHVRALLEIGRSVERGLDRGQLIASFREAVQRWLPMRVLDVALRGDVEAATPVGRVALELIERGLDAGTLERVSCVQPPLAEGEHAWAVALYGPESPVGVAVIATLFSSAADPHAELVLDACGRLANALSNARAFHELRQLRDSLQAQVEARTTELAAKADSLRETNDKLLRLDLAKRRFFTHLSHELRTPVTLLSASIETLEQNPRLDHASADRLQVARRNVTRLVHAVDDLLDLALLDEARLALQLETVDLAAVVRALRTTVGPWAEAHAVRVEMVVPDEPAEAQADIRLIDKALLNLVVNAVKFSPPGSMVELVLGREGDDVVLHVLDRGPGVADKDRERIFEAFEQADNQGPELGLGVGLSLVREIAAAHGGNVCVRDRQGGGSDFAFCLPVRAAVGHTTGARRVAVSSLEERAHALIGDSSSVTLLGEPPRAQTPPRSALVASWPAAVRPVVLVVDDEPEMLATLKIGLEEDYDVATASSGMEAVAILSDVSPNAVVTDVSMPGMSGLELCAYLRGKDETRHLTIVLLTALAATADKLRAFESGADDYVTKPFSMRELRARLKTQLEIRRLVSEVAALSNISLVGTLASGMAHEINNPLNVLINAVGPMEKAVLRNDSAVAADMADLVVSSARRIEQCISAIRSLASWSQGQVESVLLEPFLRSLVDARRHRMPGCTIVLEVDDSLARSVPLRRTEVSLLVGNLVDNAMDAAGGTGTVRVAARAEGDGILVTVGDDGPGMDAATLRGVGQPFFTTKQPGKGMGLGMFVAQQLVLHLDARLEISTQPAKGTMIRLELPMGSVRTDRHEMRAGG